jgi:flagellar basal body-associated protein FliL
MRSHDSLYHVNQTFREREAKRRYKEACREETKTARTASSAASYFASMLIILSLMVGGWCLAVYLPSEKPDDKDNEAGHDPGSSAPDNNEMTTQGGNVASHASSSYAQLMKSGDPVALSITIIVSIAILLIMAKMLWSYSNRAGTQAGVNSSRNDTAASNFGNNSTRTFGNGQK